MNDFVMYFIQICIAFACVDLLLFGRQIYRNEIQRKRLLDELEAERKEQKVIYEAWKKLIKADIARMEKLNDK